MFNLFSSKTVRDAISMHKHVQKLLNHQRDILKPEAVGAVETAIGQLKQAASDKADKTALEKQMQALEKAATSWLKPYPNAAWRENIEVLLVALAVAMWIRTFFLQPFKIPTGSMQPTLYGVTSKNLREDPTQQIPTGLDRVRQWFGGVSYLHIVAKEDGDLEYVGRPARLLILQLWQRLQVGGKTYTIWFPPDYGSSTLEARAGLQGRQRFHKGDDIIKLQVKAGDHLFVDRLAYNFRSPERGEIIVFETKGIPEENRLDFGIPGDQFYIKRLVGLGNELVQIGSDRHLVIDGKRLDSSTPRFGRIYSFDPTKPGRDSEYSGHYKGPGLSRYFSNHPEGVKIPPKSFMAMGDNTMNSLDSRSWGPFPSEYVIGRSFFVYWPITDRFGWGYRR